ncbi:uncharacterized protein BJ171DRAFT_453730 [Polychytrium aggregatum]|uniref:uncharacterized protein n=1 Tax=Polychytrium aggregatum TaxID=110093 RepID=UPI0022FECB4C|nr:uncharacterized protein BJ171DRAFT_453730 [Polychytrium aggregatum]KAI9209584.1 hypothetical protein BJ171DRAFT_453730 [Polychytrium aggregatum]
MKQKSLKPQSPAYHPPGLGTCLEQLKTKLPADAVVTDQGDLASSSHDFSYHSPRLPHAVVTCSSESQVIDVLKTCNQHSVPVIPWTAGTSLEGHTIPSRIGGLLVDVSKMDKILAIHPKDLDCVVQPGIGWMRLNTELNKHGLFFPPDAGGGACIGGMCATSCSGTFAWRYGTMKENVIGIKAVLPDGTVVKTKRRPHKSSAGYDLTHLFIGSEGTLGVITEITLKLKRLPVETQIARVQFETIREAAQLVEAIVAAGGMSVERLELMDDLTVKSVNLAYKTTLPEKTTLLMEFAGSSNAIKEQSTKVKELAQQFRSISFDVSSNQKEANELWSVRKRAFFASKHLHPDPNSVSILTTDVCVPPSHLAEILEITKKDLVESNLIGSIVAHAGDGNFHVFLLTDKLHRDQDQLRRVEEFRDRMAKRALAMDGTVTGEHGIGKGKMKLLVEELGENAIELMRKIKDAVDPNGIMNPGKVFWTKKWLTILGASKL